jgi:hypothetical protein
MRPFIQVKKHSGTHILRCRNLKMFHGGIPNPRFKGKELEEGTVGDII